MRLVIGFTDNYVRVIASEGGLWQFHATRSAMVMCLVAALAIPLGLRLRPRNLRAVAARSAIHGMAMLIYFGALAFLPVAQVAAGLFTAPIFVLILSRFVYGHAIGPVRIVAVALGFLGVVMVLGPEALAGASLAAALPVVAGALYALGNIATREWCAGESAEVLTVGFFLALGVLGRRGWACWRFSRCRWPRGRRASSRAAGSGRRGRSCSGPSCRRRGRFLPWADGARLSDHRGQPRVGLRICHLPASAFWGWVLWSEVLTPLAVAGMVLIAAAGVLIALRARASR
jgi:drug/metabolite transporter (DMT)-like permease